MEGRTIEQPWRGRMPQRQHADWNRRAANFGRWAAFYDIGPSVIGIITLSAYKLSHKFSSS